MIFRILSRFLFYFIHVLGILAFIGSVGGITFLVVGYHKNQESAVRFYDQTQTASLAPITTLPQLPGATNADTDARKEMPPAPTPISGAAAKAKTRPVAHSTPTNGIEDEAHICPSCKRFHLKSVTCASDEAFVSDVTRKAAPTKKAAPAAKNNGNKANKTTRPNTAIKKPIATAARPLTAKEADDIKLYLQMKEDVFAVMEGRKEPVAKPKQKANVWTGLGASFEFLGKVFKDY